LVFPDGAKAEMKRADLALRSHTAPAPPRSKRSGGRPLYFQVLCNTKSPRRVCVCARRKPIPGMGFDPQIAIDWARGQNSVVALLAFATVNVVGTSVLPIPIGVAMMVIGGVLFGQVTGLVVYLATSTIGAFITFAIVRALKDRVIGWLGQHAATWRRLDAAITREGLWICFLWRVAPIAPYVVSSAMISMTEISAWDYMWTTALGIIPSSFPIVSGESVFSRVLACARACARVCSACARPCSPRPHTRTQPTESASAVPGWQAPSPPLLPDEVPSLSPLHSVPLAPVTQVPRWRARS
jgi:uncharacterized membrane protein YdjX (TVP38/TMEM64 family)